MRLPFMRLLYDALTAAGCEVHRTSRLPRRGIWLGRKWDAVHIHMLDFFFPREPGRQRALALAWFFGVVRPWLRLRGIRLVWTCHELQPHEGDRRETMRPVSLRMARAADHVIVHSSAVRRELLDAVGPALARRLHFLPLGDHAPYYTPYSGSVDPAHRQPSRDHFTFSTIGYHRPNKGTDRIVDAFRQVARPDVRLVVAGHCENGAYREALERMARGDGRITLRLGSLTDDEVVTLHADADAVVFGFRECPTTASVVTAMSLGRPVVVPALGHIYDIVDARHGWLYAPGEDVDTLAAALEAAVAERETAAARGRAARERMAQDDWPSIARALRGVYTKAGTHATRGT